MRDTRYILKKKILHVPFPEIQILCVCVCVRASSVLPYEIELKFVFRDEKKIIIIEQQNPIQLFLNDHHARFIDAINRNGIIIILSINGFSVLIRPTCGLEIVEIVRYGKTKFFKMFIEIIVGIDYNDYILRILYYNDYTSIDITQALSSPFFFLHYQNEHYSIRKNFSLCENSFIDYNNIIVLYRSTIHKCTYT